MNLKALKNNLFFDAFFMYETIKNIFELSKRRINFLHNIDNRWWYFWNKTYIEWLKEEIEEVKEEIKELNSVYLEDELWDIFWDYLCLLHSLEEENKIKTKKVFERCYEKYIERLWTSAEFEQVNWEDIKKKQKERLKNEHNLRYNK